ncbi:conjugative coupling factor TraD (TOL family) [Erwinia toletana]|uniref:Conjugative coupling factor TraD (TOL family) n=1 Tax=Winslowiella toletana TaxID=92490 RepID=A0ABS4PDK8_9GAMM|nr:conjugative coupling factor TraD (TOL family) [Winslowiella toletana]
MPLADRVGHTLVMGTTRVGKTRLAELLITQDIRRGDVVIIFDPKGDADLLKRAWSEAVRAGRENEFYLFHLGWPELSARYNAIGRFGRISEVASRIAGQLSNEGNSAAFREFAWRFVNIITRALVALGKRPDYQLIARHVVNIDGLFIDYARHALTAIDRKAWEVVAQLASNINDKNTPRNLLGRDRHVVALEQYINQSGIYDPILDGLRSAVRYDRTYFDKIVASLLPLLEKLTTGSIAQLLAPDYSDLNDPRPIFDWPQLIRKRGIAYVAFDALSDSEVSGAVGNSMFADLVSVAGHIYKFGINDGLPGNSSERVPINLHCDEFSELMGEEFIPLINKGGGTGIQVTAYTQTLSDIQAGIGSVAKAGQVVGNFNNLIMLRVRETATAELLTGQLPEVEIRSSSVTSGVTDASVPAGQSDFTSHTSEQINLTRVPMLDSSALVQLPKGQAFALLEGGQLWKIRLPLPVHDRRVPLPASIQQIAEAMQKNYRSEERWWNNNP